MKNRLSAITLFCMMGVMLWCTTVFYPRYSQPGSNATIAWDGAGYYWYLPSLFIYHDLARQHWADSLIGEYTPGPANISELGFRTDNGRVVLKYSAGMAVAESPFFFIAHLLAKPLGYEPDGFSRPYQAAIQFGALLVAFIGLWLIRKLLLYYYPDGIVAACLFLLVVGSNYLNYSAIDGSISHSWLFTLYSALLLCSRSFYIRQTRGKALTIGALCGLAILIRPTEIISCVIPLLWGLSSLRWQAIRERLLFLRSNALHLLFAGAAAVSIAAIQVIYWKVVAGHWLVYSYQEQGFSWLHPHVLSYTFSYRSGWITYTPIMLLSILGFIPFLYRGPNRVMILISCGLAFYLVTAWDIWWYAGTGGRAMIQYYPLLLFPMATLLQWLAAKKPWRVIALPAILLLVYVNVWFTYQAHGGGLYDSDAGMSRAYYWRVIGRWSAPDETSKLKDGNYLYEHPMPANARLIYRNSFHQKDAGGHDSVLTMGGNCKNSAEYTFPFRKQGNEHWVRAFATFYCIDKEWVGWNMTQFIITARKGNDGVRGTMIRVQRFLDKGQRKTLFVDLELPPSADIDSLNVYFWNVESEKKITVEDLKVWAF